MIDEKIRAKYMVQPLRGSDVRQLNERIVLNLFYDTNNVSQSDVVAQTGLKASTVLRIFSNLEKSGEILLADPVENSDAPPETKRGKIGRRPAYYRLNPTSHYALGLSFDKDVMELLIVDFTLNVVHSARKSGTLPSSPDELAIQIAEFAKDALHEANVEPTKILGMGVGCPGTIDPEQGILFNPSLISSPCSYPLADKLKSLLGFRIFLQCGDLLAAQYYQRYEGNSEFDRCLYVSVGSEVTAAFYVKAANGTLSGIPSLQVGQLLSHPPDAVFGMKNVSTWNDFCSEGSILSFASDAAGATTMAEVNDALEKGNTSLAQFAKNVGDALSFWVNNLCALFQPKTVIFASRAKRFSQIVTDELSHVLQEKYSWPHGQELQIIGKAHNHRKISRSAIDLVFDNEFVANSGWKVPQLLRQPENEKNWDFHMNKTST